MRQPIRSIGRHGAGPLGSGRGRARCAAAVGIIAGITAGIMAAITISSCRDAPGVLPESQPQPQPQPESQPRVVALAPAAAEMLAALGLAPRVVGVGDFVAWPPSLAALPKVGSYDVPNLERVLSLRATHVVSVRSQAAAGSHERLRALGVRVVELDTSTFAGALEAILQVGAAMGRPERARSLVDDIAARLRDIEQRAAAAPRRSVLFVVGRQPLYVAGPRSHLDELIRVAGGVNVMNDLTAPYQLASFEAVLARRPEVIIDASDNRLREPRGATAGEWARWSSVPAVAHGSVYQVHPERVTIPGPRLAAMAELVAQLVHPEIFGAPPAAAFQPLGAEPLGVPDDDDDDDDDDAATPTER